MTCYAQSCDVSPKAILNENEPLLSGVDVRNGLVGLKRVCWHDLDLVQLKLSSERLKFSCFPTSENRLRNRVTVVSRPS